MSQQMGISPMPNDAWLEGRYGVRLLIYDIQDIVKAIRNISSKRDRFKERAGFSETWTETPNTPTTYLLHPGDLSFTGTINHDLSVRGSVIADIKPPKFEFNLLKTGVELIPYSFVLDWIISISQWIDSLTFFALSSEWYAASGVKYTRTADLRSDWMTSSYPSHYHLGSTWESVTITETITLRIPTSVPYRPFVRLNFNDLKAYDLVALIGQALRR